MGYLLAPVHLAPIWHPGFTCCPVSGSYSVAPSCSRRCCRGARMAGWRHAEAYAAAAACSLAWRTQSSDVVIAALDVSGHPLIDIFDESPVCDRLHQSIVSASALSPNSPARQRGLQPAPCTPLRRKGGVQEAAWVV